MPLGIFLKSIWQKTIKRAEGVWSFWRSGKTTSDDLTKKQVWQLTTRRRWPTWGQWKQLPSVLSKTEKIILQVSLMISAISLVTLGAYWFVSHRVSVPVVGGSYTEGLVGAPQFINPLYAPMSDVDADLTKLIYSGLFRWTQEGGLETDLAESYTISEDQKTYTIKLRDNAKWHNGDPVRAGDVIFTIQSLQDPAYHSPLAVSFRGVTISEIDELTVQFVLTEPFAPFLSSLTVGILPSAIWAELPAKNFPLTSLNLSPIGSGPYKFEKYSMEKRGEIKSYTMVRNSAFYGQPAKIEKLIFKFYHDAESAVTALANQNIEGLNFVPSHLIDEVWKNKNLAIFYPSMPQAVTLFFNQETQPILKDLNIRKALSKVINKEEIVEKALFGRGQVINSPLLPNFLGFEEIPEPEGSALDFLAKTDYTNTSADGFLAKTVKKTEGGETVETLEELTLTLTTVSQPTYLKVAEAIAEQAKTVGIKIQIEAVEPVAFYDQVVKPRAYQMLLTATQFGLDSDPYSFWHSSQSKDPGLNLSLYTNKKVDELLEKGRSDNNPETRSETYRQFQSLLSEDLPAIFLYQPNYAYAVSDKIKNISLTEIKTPSDRFQHLTDWYIKTKNVLR